eukprot:g2017.t1
MATISGSGDTLSARFGAAVDLFEAVEASTKAGADPGFQAQVCEALVAVDALCAMVDELSLFSSNEDLDDASTGSLPFLLLDFYAGKLEMKVVSEPDAGPEGRMAQLRRAMARLTCFEGWCERLAVPAVDGEDSDAVGARSAAEATRARKIARHKRAQAQRARVAELRALERRAVQRREEPDEDRVRERCVLALQLARAEAADEQTSAAGELEMLEHMAKMMAQEGGGGGAGSGQRAAGAQADGGGGRGDAREAARASGPLEVTRIEKDARGQLQVKRQELKEGVFQPFWRQPTKTLEQLAEEELADALRRQQAEKEGEAHRPPRRIKQLEEEGLEDDAALADLATGRDRSWDDWKDENPRGIGNKGTTYHGMY